jgi:hypothetical protein
VLIWHVVGWEEDWGVVFSMIRVYIYKCRQRSDMVEAEVEVTSGGNNNFPRKDLDPF